MDNELLVKTVRELCKKNNIPVSQLENELNFGAGLISRWVKSSPSIDKIVDIADYFHVSLDEVVGRNQNTNTNYEFVNNLINLTKFKKVEWTLLAKMPFGNNYKYIETYCNIKEFDSYPFEKRKINTFILEYEKGFITLRGYLIVNQNTIEQYDLSLYIQPDIEVEPVYQICKQEQLLKLYKCIEESLYGETPESLAEDFKQQFISNSVSKLLGQITQYIEDSQDDATKSKLNELLNDEKAKKILVESNLPEVQQIISTFTNPKMAQAMESAQQLIRYFGDINNTKNKK